MEGLKIEIVGAGAIGQIKASKAGQFLAVAVKGEFATNQKVVRKVIRKLSSPPYPTYQSLLAQSDLEADLLSISHHSLHKCRALAFPSSPEIGGAL